jgi:hypothetical protein
MLAKNNGPGAKAPDKVTRIIVTTKSRIPIDNNKNRATNKRVESARDKKQWT